MIPVWSSRKVHREIRGRSEQWIYRGWKIVVYRDGRLHLTHAETGYELLIRSRRKGFRPGIQDGIRMVNAFGGAPPAVKIPCDCGCPLPTHGHQAAWDPRGTRNPEARCFNRSLCGCRGLRIKVW